MPTCKYVKCGLTFADDPRYPKKEYCNRGCSARANALTQAGKPQKKRYPRTCGRGKTYHKGFPT